MSTLAADISPMLVQTADRIDVPVQVGAPSREIVSLAFVLVALQIADGVLTGIGVHHLGTAMEGNMFLRFLMEQFGMVAALIVVKVFAIFVVGALTLLASVVPWLTIAFRAMICLYLMAAIIPWSAIILKYVV